MKYGMSTMIITSLLVISAIAISLTIFINVHKFSEAYSNAVSDRFYFAIGEAAKVVETEMQLGQTIDKLKNAQATVDQLKAIDENIISAEIFDTNGRTLYSTDNSYLFDFIPDSWELASRKATGSRWKVTGNYTHVLGLKLNDSFNQPTGSLAVLFSADLEQQVLQDIRAKLSMYAMWLSGGTALILAVTVFFLTRPLKTYLKEMELALDEGVGGDEGVQKFVSTYEQAGQDLDQLEEKLQRIDEGRR